MSLHNFKTRLEYFRAEDLGHVGFKSLFVALLLGNSFFDRVVYYERRAVLYVRRIELNAVWIQCLLLFDDPLVIKLDAFDNLTHLMHVKVLLIVFSNEGSRWMEQIVCRRRLLFLLLLLLSSCYTWVVNRTFELLKFFKHVLIMQQCV